MGDLVDHVKAETLLAMYRSVDRMNHHIVEGNDAGVVSEQGLQQNLRKSFEELSDGEQESL